LVEALGAMKTALRSFGRYVPKEIVRDLVARGDDVAVGGGRRSVTVMFTDITGFTKTTESWPPERVLDDLSGYFEALSAAILSTRGTIDKFIGDGIMAFWNAPSPDEQHASHACLAALACRAIGKQKRSGSAAESSAPFLTRFGLHTGTAVVGNVGSHERLQYTAIGSMVNLASRIESLNKQFGTEILISETVAMAVHGTFELRPLGKVVAVGTSQPTEIFELLGTAAPKIALAIGFGRRPILLMSGDIGPRRRKLSQPIARGIRTTAPRRSCRISAESISRGCRPTRCRCSSSSLKNNAFRKVDLNQCLSRPARGAWTRKRTHD
jgi:adenylate cyclase